MLTIFLMKFLKVFLFFILTVTFNLTKQVSTSCIPGNWKDFERDFDIIFPFNSAKNFVAEHEERDFELKEIFFLQ